MKLTPPSNAAFAIGLVLLAISLLLKLGLIAIPSLDASAFWIAWVGGAVLAAGAAFRGI